MSKQHEPLSLTHDEASQCCIKIRDDIERETHRTLKNYQRNASDAIITKYLTGGNQEIDKW